MSCCDCLTSSPLFKKMAMSLCALFFFLGITAPIVMVVAIMTKAEDPAEAREPHSPPEGWPHKGAFGTYDQAAMQRGFQVYKQVCSACHSLKLPAYRNLADLGFKPAEIKAIAADYQVTDGPNDVGEMYQRPAAPSDHFVGPYPNDAAARNANNGALPPDLSLIIKARHHHEDYVYSILTGYGMPLPAGEKVQDGLNYNPYFQGHQIAMPQPLNDGAVTYADGTKATVPQMASDVVQFLSWASEPKLNDRRETGTKVTLFLIVFAGIMYGVKRRLWKNRH